MIRPHRFAALAVALVASAPLTAQQPAFTLEQALAAPFPDNLVAAPAGGAVAWVFNANGARNIWFAAPPEYQGRQVTAYPDDDGQEIGDLAWTPDGKAIVYTRGGGVNGRGEFPNPRSLTTGVKQEIWLVTVPGGAVRRLGEGNSPAVSPKGDRVAFLQRGQIWWASLTDSAPAEQLIHARGSASALRWSPDGGKLAFVSNRGDHAFIAVYDVVAKALRFLDPALDRDDDPVWSPDGARIAFTRAPPEPGRVPFTPRREAQPWSIRVAEVATRGGRRARRRDERRGDRMDAGAHRRRQGRRVPAQRRPQAPPPRRADRRGIGAGPRPASRRRGLPRSSPGRAAAGRVLRRRRHADPRPAVSAQGPARRGPAPRRHLLPWRLAPANAARLALHVLLPQRVRAESVPGEPRLRGAVGQLPQRHRLRPQLPRGAALRRPGRERVQRRDGSGAVPARPRRRGPRQDRAVGRLLRRLPDGAGARACVGPVRGGRGPARRARLEHGDPELGDRVRPGEAGGCGARGVRVVPDRVRRRLALPGVTAPRRRPT